MDKIDIEEATKEPHTLTKQNPLTQSVMYPLHFYYESKFGITTARIIVNLWRIFIWLPLIRSCLKACWNLHIHCTFNFFQTKVDYSLYEKHTIKKQKKANFTVKNIHLFRKQKNQGDSAPQTNKTQNPSLRGWKSMASFWKRTLYRNKTRQNLHTIYCLACILGDML